MDEKLSSAAAVRPRTPSRQRLWKALLFVLIAYIFSSIAVDIHQLVYTRIKSPVAGDERAGTPDPVEEPVHVHYEGEHLEWRPCGEINKHAVECSDIKVPMDQLAPEKSGNKTFNIAVIRMRAHNATQGKNLLLNPGGPGGSGVEFLHRKGEELNTIVGEGYHLVSFDPRGINQSTPRAVCYRSPETRVSHASVRSRDAVADSGEISAWTDNFVQACADTMGEHGKYINTPQTAADMNSILDALGQEKMVYWGFSYGTLLGQTYAAMFPERSERVIIDGVVNVFDWYDELFDTEMFDSTEEVLDGFFVECAKAGENCALSDLGDTAQELEHKVLDFVFALKEEPLGVYINDTVYGLITFEMVFHEAILSALYKPENWYLAAQTLASLLKGNATEMFLAFGVGSAWGIGGEANEFVHLNDALTGPEHWPKDRATFLNMSMSFIDTSPFAMAVNTFYYQRQKWNLPKTHNFHPKKEIETAHPLLVLSTTYDPVCPLKSAKVARSTFKDSRLVEVLGYGHCSVAVPSSCVAEHVRNFLYDGTLPESDVKCEGDGKLFVPPKDHDELVLATFGDDKEKRDIYRAQVDLARDTEWPKRWRR